MKTPLQQLISAWHSHTLKGFTTWLLRNKKQLLEQDKIMAQKAQKYDELLNAK